MAGKHGGIGRAFGLALVGAGLAGCPNAGMIRLLPPADLGPGGPAAAPAGRARPEGADPAPAASGAWQAPGLEAGEPRFPPIKGRTWRYAGSLRIGGAEADVARVAYAPDGGTLYLGQADGTLVAWDLEAMKARWRAQAGTEVLAVDPTGALIATAGRLKDVEAGRSALRVFDAATGDAVGAYTFDAYSAACRDLGRTYQPRRLQFGPSGDLYAFMDTEVPVNAEGDAGRCLPFRDMPVIRLDPRTGQERWHYLHTVPACGGGEPFACGTTWPTMAVSPAGDRIAVGGCDASIAFVDAATGREEGRAPCLPDAIPDLELRYPEMPAGSFPQSLVWSRDAARLFAMIGTASRSYGHVLAYEGAGLGRPQGPRVLARTADKATEAALSPDGRLLAQDGGDVVINDVATGALAYVTFGGGFAWNPVRREFATPGIFGAFLYREDATPAPDDPAETDNEDAARKATPPAALKAARATLRQW